MADDIFSISFQSSVVCNECQFISTKEEKLDMLPLQPYKDISSSLSKFCEVEPMEGPNRYDCPLCQSLQEATIQKCISKCGNVLICHLKRFGNFQDNTFKDCSFYRCLPSKGATVSVPISVDGETSVSKQYSLVATINHSGRLDRGHYWSFVKRDSTWYESNDTSVTKVNEAKVNNSSSYILIYSCVQSWVFPVMLLLLNLYCYFLSLLSELAHSRNPFPRIRSKQGGVNAPAFSLLGVTIPLYYPSRICPKNWLSSVITNWVLIWLLRAANFLVRGWSLWILKWESKGDGLPSYNPSYPIKFSWLYSQ